MQFGKKLNGNSLIITVIVALVIAIFCFSFILLAYYSRLWKSNVRIENKLERNLWSGINIVLADTAMVVDSSFETLDLFGQGYDSVSIHKENWGIFPAATVRASINPKKLVKTFLYGAELGQYFEGCLYVADHQRPVSLAGDVKLVGDAWLSKPGLKASYINQRGYNYQKLIDGEIKNSTDELPLAHKSFISDMYRMVNKFTDTSFIGKYKIESIPDELSQSFQDSAVIIAKRGSFIITTQTYKGHIILVSDSVIEVKSMATLENIILFAPVIIFNEGFSGTVQAFATDSIVAKENADFKYPSALILLKPDANPEFAKITIHKNCKLEGFLLSFSENSIKTKTYVTIDKGATIKGVVYVSGYTELKGNVYGSVLTDYFIYRSYSTIYENHLVDIEINRNKLSKYFIAPPLLGNNKNAIIQWVE